MPSRKADFFEEVARHGDPLSFRSGDRAKLERLRARLGSLRGLSIVEPGCGAGHLTRWLSRWVGPAGSVEAFDPSRAMLGWARRALTGRDNTRFRRVRCETARFAEGQFDRVICFRVLPHFDRLDPVFARFACWLQPGGRLHIVHWEGRDRLAAIHGGYRAVATDVLPPPRKLAESLRRHRFTVTAWVDDAEEVYLEATRDSP
jgi:ubiquinone/menaquinone biosynthesis C-methylase UbiE